jgi:hypothetical protein
MSPSDLIEAFRALTSRQMASVFPAVLVAAAVAVGELAGELLFEESDPQLASVNAARLTRVTGMTAERPGQGIRRDSMGGSLPLTLDAIVIRRG